VLSNLPKHSRLNLISLFTQSISFAGISKGQYFPTQCCSHRIQSAATHGRSPPAIRTVCTCSSSYPMRSSSGLPSWRVSSSQPQRTQEANCPAEESATETTDKKADTCLLASVRPSITSTYPSLTKNPTLSLSPALVAFLHSFPSLQTHFRTRSPAAGIALSCSCVPLLPRQHDWQE